MRSGLKQAIGVILVIVGSGFLIGGFATGDMWWFPRRHHVAGAPPSTGSNYWATDPVGFLLIALVWALLVLAGVVGIVKARRERAGRT